MAEKAPDESVITRSPNFTCGVVEGFYGRPWTTEQRKDLFQKLKKWGMDSYVYAPKDDYKHRAYWRELYTVEEAEHLTGLITAAKDNGITFYYALSPGLDISYSSAKEVSAVKRKLDQVSQFGCSAFALLFDDIEPEMSSADKEVFQSFAHAQVSVSNEIFQHLNQPRFMVCPTEYCAARAAPNVSSSEYLNTLGSKLLPEIDIMWTGPKVVSRIMSLESIEEITEVMRRPPVLWDNIHANDYDQKRVFLGPYSWRSPQLIGKLRGVMTNPNCEYGPNFVGIHTLAQWSRCNVDGKRDLSLNDSVSADIKLETETEDGGTGEDIPSNLTPNMYHPRRALRNAISDWLDEFSRSKQAWGPIIKPQPVIPVPIPVPILPSINTCMSLTTTTTTASNSSNITQTITSSSQLVSSAIPYTALSTTALAPPAVPPNTNQLEALAEVCSTVPNVPENLPITPIAAPVMNSLASESKIVALPPLSTPLPLPLTVSLPAAPSVPIAVPLPLPSSASSTCEPMDCNPTPNGSPAHLTKTAASSTEDVAMAENGSASSVAASGNGSSTAMQVDSSDDNTNFQSTSNNMVVEAAQEEDGVNESSTVGLSQLPEKYAMTFEDLSLLCDLFYLPFEHGSAGTQILHDFNWLKTHAHVICNNHSSNGCSTDASQRSMKEPEVQEWYDRATKLDDMTKAVNQLFTRLTSSPNRELLHEIYPYVWDARGIISVLNSFVKWLGCGNFSHLIGNFTLGNFTWFSKGWKETFMSGEHEPWVFRGGLIADLQRLLPVDSGTDLFVYKVPEVPSSKMYDVRPGNLLIDQHHIRSICRSAYSTPSCDQDPSPDLIPDSFLGCLLEAEQLVSLVIEDDIEVVGYAVATLDAKQYYSRMKTDFIPTMRTKYPFPDSPYNSSSLDQERIRWFHSYDMEVPEQTLSSHPAAINCAILSSVEDPSALKRLVVCMLAALRAHGCLGVHTTVRSTDQISLELYGRLGFVDLNPALSSSFVVLGRTF